MRPDVHSITLFVGIDRSMASGEFVPEQHFCPKYSIDNCDSSELVEVGDGKRSHPRRDKLTWFETNTSHEKILTGCGVMLSI